MESPERALNPHSLHPGPKKYYTSEVRLRPFLTVFLPLSFSRKPNTPL